MSEKHVVVVGAGVIGVSSAWYLAQQGFRVTVLDKADLATGCSHGNCGFVCPSHVLPLAEPGALAVGIRSLFMRNSPLCIRWRFDLSQWSWMLRFAKRCNRTDMITAGRSLQPLLRESIRLYDGLAESGVIRCDFDKRGLLFVYRDRKALDHFDATNTLLTDMFCEPAEKLTAEALTSMEPALREDLAGAWCYHDDAQLNPALLMESWRQRAADHGVTFLGSQAVASLLRRGGRVVGVATTSQEFPADHVVVAAGALSGRLKELIGVRLPVLPGKGYSVTMPRPEISPRTPIIFPETRVAVTPFKDELRLGSTMEFAGYDSSIRAERLALLRAGSQPYLREQLPSSDDYQWFGWRPMTYDGLPIIGRSPEYANVWVATGHGMLGVSMAPATGRLVAELVAEQPPSIDPDPYSASRFVSR